MTNNANRFYINLSDKNYKLYNPDITVFTNDTIELNINVFSDKKKTVPRNISDCEINLYVEREVDGVITNIEQLYDNNVKILDGEKGQFQIILKKSILQFESFLSIQVKLLKDDQVVSLEPFCIDVRNSYVGSTIMKVATDDIQTIESIKEQLEEYKEELLKITTTVEEYKNRIESSQKTFDNFLIESNDKINVMIKSTKDKLEILSNEIKSISDDSNKNTIRPIRFKTKDVVGSNLIYFESDYMPNLKNLLKNSFQITVGGYTDDNVWQQALGYVVFNSAKNMNKIRVVASMVIDKNVDGKYIKPKVMFENCLDIADINENGYRLMVKTLLSKDNVNNISEAFCVLTPISNCK